MTSSFTVFVKGKPVPQGSKNVGRHGQLYERNALALHAWRESIKWESSQRMRGEAVITEPVEVYLDFYFERAHHHYTSRGKLKDASPRRHVFKPDLDKLSRAVLDAISGTVISDDRQVVSLSASKQWADRDGETGVMILVAVPLEKDAESELV